MKNKLIHIIVAIVTLLSFPNVGFGQAPTLGTAANFVLFSSKGQVSNTGISQVTGRVGSNNTATSPGFGNVNGVMDNIDPATAQCALDLTSAYNQLVADPPGTPHAILLGNSEVLGSGTYDISAAATMNLNLYLHGSSSDVFIFRINGAFATNALSRVILTGGALACNVFWKVEGAVTMAAGTSMKGTVIANNGLIQMGAGDTLEGRALTTVGAITVTSVLAYTPIGCGSPVLTGPSAPDLLSTVCYTLFSSDGPVTDIGSVSHVVGDVGTNLGTTTGYNPLFVTGTIHAIPDISTGQCATDLTSVYNYLNTLPYDIQLLYPTQLGNGLVLTPHTYIMKAAATLTDTLYLNAEGDASAQFVIQIEGAFTESGTGAKVKLINGALAQNVFWLVNGAVTLNNFSVFNGSIISSGAITLNTGDTLFGRALTTVGALNTKAIVAKMSPGCGNPPVITLQPVKQSACVGDSVSFSVTATGSGLTYQWRKGNVNVVNGGNISGATTRILTFKPVTALNSALNYNVIVSGTFPPKDTSVSVSLTVNPLPVANAGPDKGVCKGDSVSLGTPAIIGDTYKWSPSTWLNSSTDAQPNVGPKRDTTYILTVINTSTGCKNRDTVNVTLNPPPIANAGPDKGVCKGDSVSIGTPAIVGNTYKWSPSTWLNSSTDAQPNVGSKRDTTYILTVTNTSTGCRNSDTVNVTVNLPPIANAGPDATICKGDSVRIGTPSTIGDTYKWSPSTWLNSSTDAQPNASPARDTTYILTVTNTATGCKNTDTVKITVNPLPVTNAGPDKSICIGDSTTIGTPAVIGNTYSWLPIAGLNSHNKAQPNASPKGTVTYTLTVSNGKCSDTSTVIVSVNAFAVANAGPDKNICIGESTSIGTPAILGDTYSWSPSEGLNSSIVAQPKASPSSTTLYILKVTNGNCSNIDSVKVIVHPLPVADAGSNQYLCDGGNVKLGAPAVAGDTYMWTPGNGLNSSKISQPTANPDVTTLYTLVETDTLAGCSMSNEVTVTVEPNQFYDGFSPNGDGINDFWDIPMLNCYPTNTVTIINRWGSEVWNGENYNNASVKWTGENMSGKSLPDGTYYYIIKYNNTEKRGWVFIKR